MAKGQSMRLLGYSDKWSVKPGDKIAFMVSSERPSFDVDVVRLFQVDDRKVAPPYREEVVQATCSGTYAGRFKGFLPGSYLRVPDHPLLRIQRGISIVAWIFPTAIGRGTQGIVGKRSSDTASGYDLFLEGGHLRFEICRASGDRFAVQSTEALEDRTWYFIAATWDSETGEMALWQEMHDVRAPHLLGKRDVQTLEKNGKGGGAVANNLDLLIAALHSGPTNEPPVRAHFNGKIGSPQIYARRLSLEEIEGIRSGRPANPDALVASWDFAAFPFGTTIPDKSGHGMAAKVVNNPMRAVTGHKWDGGVQHFQMDPEQYEAIHFHDDDMDDAGWSPDFIWAVPDNMPSGVYAARLTSKQEDEEYIPFYVRPAKSTSSILFLAPTFSYLAYANERFHAQPFVDWRVASDLPLELARQDKFAAEHPELGCSLYDVHTDGSISCYSSSRRPIVNFRPKLTSYWNGAGRHFGADMYLIDWLDRKGFNHDVVTDHDLHSEGLELLSPYRVVLLGSHPEYFSFPMRKALEMFVAQGGHLMYLGGNGCWWVTSVDPARPYVIEVRKQAGMATVRGVDAEPGEEFLSTSGERGGTWRSAGKPPEALFGVGYTSQGFCRARGYHRTPDSFDPHVAFIFEGIGKDEVIGEFGLAYGGAAGDEFDRVNIELGSPRNTRILASSFDHPEDFCVYFSFPFLPKAERASRIRADISYYETDGGGAVFSVGSMCWLTSLAYNGYDNNVARVTENVLRKFMC
jgi:N,N-dimethylformamidase